MVEADSGTIGGRDSQEFILVADSGEDTVMICEGCGYAANAEKAVFVKPPLKQRNRSRSRASIRRACALSTTWPNSWTCTPARP